MQSKEHEVADDDSSFATSAALRMAQACQADRRPTTVCSVLSLVIYRKLLSNLLKVYPMKGRLISGLSSTTPTALAAWTCCALSRVALSV